MELFKQLDTSNIDFVLIDRLIKSENNEFEDMLEFTVWEKPRGLNIIGYKVRYSLDDSFKILYKLSEYDVDANYMITELEDVQVLAGISCTESLVSKILGEGEINKLELKVPDNSIYNILHKTAVLNGSMKLEDSDGFGSLRGLHFNESTLDIVWRYKSPNSSFKTFPLMQDDIVNDFSVRVGEILGIHCGTQHNIEGGLIEQNFVGSTLDTNGFELYSNGVRLDNVYLIAIVSTELLINYFARAFDNMIMYKTLEALHSHICEFEHPKYGKSAYRAPRDYESICTIKYRTRMPSTTKILEILNNLSYKSDMDGRLDAVLKKCSELYSKETVKVIGECLAHYKHHNPMHLFAITKIDSVTVGNYSTELAIIANCLKCNFARNDIFRQSYVGTLTGLSSSVFDASIDIQTFPSQSILLQQYLRQQGM